MNLDDIFLCDSSNNQPIDIVYTFVNPTDKKWLRKYYLYNNRLDGVRFDFNQDQIYFSLRTIEKYMPWINKIYIITDNQRFFIGSSFLQSRVVWIDHKDIIPNNILPTFNSMVIESFIWQITDLCEHFLYMNDDMFLGSSIFYHDLIDLYTNKPIQFYGGCRYYNHPWIRNINNTNKLFKELYNTQKDLCPQHAPYFIKKSLYKETHDIFNKYLNIMYLKDKIRSYNNYAHNLLFLYALYATYKNEVINKKTSFSPLYSMSESSLNKIIHNRKKFYCFFSKVKNTEQQRYYNKLQQAILE